jgi:hypothetical protein
MSSARTAAALCGYLDIAAREPFSWQRHNCTHFAAGWWHLMTGCDALAGLTMPAGPAACRRQLRDMGMPLVDLVGQRTGRAAIPASFAQVGDLVAVPTTALTGGDNGAGVALGICCGRTAALLAADGACVHVPMATAQCAWALGVVA